MTTPEGLPHSIGRPATRALHAAGYPNLLDLDGVAAADLLRLHGVGPKAVAVLQDALTAQGLSLR